jgi:MYXO-CTERM domain-containing protein
MYRPCLLGGILLLTTLSFGQQPDTTLNPNPTANQNPNAYNTYNRPVEVSHGHGNWGWLGLLGLAGLFGRSRRDTVVRGRDEYVTGQGRRVA